MLRYKHPIEYEFDPTEIDKGIQWLTLKLKNTGKETLKKLRAIALSRHFLSFSSLYISRTLSHRA